MKKYLILSVISLLPLMGFSKAQTPGALVSLSYRKGEAHEQYWIKDSSAGPSSLEFQKNEKPVQKKKVVEADARLLVRFFNDIYWETKNGTPVNPAKCTPYATLKIANEAPVGILWSLCCRSVEIDLRAIDNHMSCGTHDGNIDWNGAAALIDYGHGREFLAIVLGIEAHMDFRGDRPADSRLIPFPVLRELIIK
jgi:hypothetical protein